MVEMNINDAIDTTVDVAFQSGTFVEDLEMVVRIGFEGSAMVLPFDPDLIRKLINADVVKVRTGYKGEIQIIESSDEFVNISIVNSKNATRSPI